MLQHCVQLKDLMAEALRDLPFEIPYSRHLFLSLSVSAQTQRCCFSPSTDVKGLEGELSVLIERIELCRDDGQFEWVDNVLVKAVEHGYWLLVSHANFCRQVSYCALLSTHACILLLNSGCTPNA